MRAPLTTVARTLPHSLAAGLALTMISAGGLHAQDPGSARPKEGSFRLGPVYLSAQIPFTAGRDSNVYNNPDAVGDQSITASPTVQAVLPLTRRARLRGTGGVVPQWFHTEASQRHTDLFGRVVGEVDVGRLTAFGGVGAGHYRQRFSLEIDDRVLRRESTNVLGATLRLRRRVSVTASEANVTSTFDPDAVVQDQPVSVALDRKTTTRRGELKFPLTRKTTLVPWVDFVTDRFLHPLPDVPSRVLSQRYAVALEFSELAFLTGRLAAGVRHFDSGNGVVPYTGPYLAANLGSPFLFGTRLQLFAARDVSYSVTANTTTDAVRNTYIATDVRADVLIELPWRLRGRVFGGYGESAYLLPTMADVTVVRRVDHAWTGGGALLRRLGDHLSLGVIGQRVTRTSPIPDRNYQDNLYGITGEVRF